MALKRPLAVMRKTPGAPGEEAAVRYEVVGVVRKKVHFRTRPKALISAPRADSKRQKRAGLWGCVPGQ